jgi:site-specific DNA recombinase
VNARHLAAVPEEPKRVVLYVRVSALMGRGGEDFHSPDVQIGAMRRATSGMREVGVIDDDIDQTGRTFSREGIDKIRHLVETGAVDALAVYNLSRFGRNVLESLKFLNWLADRGVTILSATEHVDTSTPSGRWMLTNMLAIAEMRSDEIGAEWSRAINHRALAGKWHGKPPAGYVRGPDGRLILDDPRVADAVTSALRRYADGELGLPIRRSLQAATGLLWAPSAFKSMLRNRAYLGVVHVRGPGGLVEVPGAHPPLVDEQTWLAIQDRIAKDRTTPPRVLNPKYALTGLGICGSCNGPVNHRIDKQYDCIRLVCVHRQEDPARCAGCGGLRAAEVERVILEKIAEHIADLRGDVGAQAAQLARASGAGVDAGSINRELGETRRAMARATERWARGKIDDRSYDAAMVSLRASEETLAVALAGLRHTAAAPAPRKIVALGEKLLSLWPRMDGAQRNQALRDLVEKVVISPGVKQRRPADERVAVRWR